MKLALLLLFALSHAWGEVKETRLSPADKVDVEKMLNTYVNAFDTGNMVKLNKVVSTQFLDRLGGADRLRDQFQKVNERAGRKISSPEYRVDRHGTYVRFSVVNSLGEVEETMTDEEWFRIKLMPDGWMILSRETDFTPETY